MIVNSQNEINRISRGWVRIQVWGPKIKLENLSTYKEVQKNSTRLVWAEKEIRGGFETRSKGQKLKLGLWNFNISPFGDKRSIFPDRRSSIPSSTHKTIWNTFITHPFFLFCFLANFPSHRVLVLSRISWCDHSNRLLRPGGQTLPSQLWYATLRQPFYALSRKDSSVQVHANYVIICLLYYISTFRSGCITPVRSRKAWAPIMVQKIWSRPIIAGKNEIWRGWVRNPV